MAALTSMAIAGATLAAGSTAMTAYSQKKAKDFNAAQMRQEAVREEQDSRRMSTAMQENARRELASIKARFAKSGLDFVGTPMEVLAEKKFLLDREILESKRQSAARQRKLRTQAEMEKKEGRSLLTSGLINAVGQGISGFSSIPKMNQLSPSGGGMTTDWQGTPRIENVGAYA